MADVPGVLKNSIFKQRSDIFVAGGVVLVVMMMIIPLPTVLLDILMTFNLLLSLLIILIVLYTKQALEFSVFPTILLVSTVFGLALNVSSTRLILGQGSEFDGRIVRAFSGFVVGSSGLQGIIIGFIIFIIIIAVQFIVITKGATRVAEVAARFTLDALPGRQMAIEAEYNSGAISEEVATKKKNDLQKQVDFYGSMDGASKFVSGNVKIGILITLINMVGGIVVGMTVHGETIDVALNSYITLAIGDGLVTQFPALLISTATGIIVTRAISDGTFGSDVTTQFSGQARVYWIGSVFLLVLAFLPGFPWYVLIPMAGLTGFLAFRLSRKQAAVERAEYVQEEAEKASPAQAEMSPVVPLDPLSLELGYGLIPLVDKDQGAELLDRITRIRREKALDLGLVVPRIRIIDNMRLEPAEYCVKIKGVEVGRGIIRIGHYLAINPGGEKEELPGEKTVDPAFGLPALWITEEQREAAERAGYTVVDSPSIIATHLTHIIERHASEILGRQEVQSILDTLKSDYPAVVGEVSNTLQIGEIQKVLQGLLLEQTSIRNMVSILETLADYATVSKDIGFLIEKCRQALGRQICLQYADEDKNLRVLTIQPQLEQQIVASRLDTAGGPIAALEPSQQRAWIETLSNSVREVQERGEFPIILCSEAARPLIKSSSEREIPDLAVLSVPEIVADMKIEALGEIRLGEV
ncbi:MAG: flagellar biosynthesis protein FlhA [Spirochaetales bacterium]|jgi:flagellar biosynthesis protein FlhA|nr:flagellar biosynthesis protein FlhA [Spirochaetales bacterium]